MSGILIDTNVLLALALDPDKVKREHRDRLASQPRYISQICGVELAIKLSIGKLVLPPPFQTDFTLAFHEMAERMSADILPIEMKHIDRLSRLPLFHRDPFDRLIIAQAIEDDLTVMTRDRVFSAYPGLKLVTL